MLSITSLLYITSASDMFIWGLTAPVIPVAQKRLGITATESSLISSLYSCISLVMAPVLGMASDKIGKQRMLIISTSFSCIGILCLAISNDKVFYYLGRCIPAVFRCGALITQAYLAEGCSSNETSTTFICYSKKI